MGIEEHLPGGLLLTTVEKAAGYARAHSLWPAFFGLACCAMEVLAAGGPRHDLARFGMEKVSNTPRQADLMIVSGRVSQKMAPVLRQVYDQMSEPKWVIAMGVAGPSPRRPAHLLRPAVPSPPAEDGFPWPRSACRAVVPVGRSW